MFRRNLLTALLPFVAAACDSQVGRISDSPAQAELAEVEAVLRALPQALEDYDFNRLSDLFDPDLQWIEGGPPVPVEDLLKRFHASEAAQAIVDFGQLRDLKVEVENDFAWGTWLLDAAFTADTDEGLEFLRAVFGTSDLSQRNWSMGFAESAVLRKTDSGWRFVFGHTTPLPDGG